jgi:hypothetical protein
MQPLGVETCKHWSFRLELFANIRPLRPELIANETTSAQADDSLPSTFLGRSPLAWSLKPLKNVVFMNASLNSVIVCAHPNEYSGQSPRSWLAD